MSHKAIIISADEIKKTIPEYTPIQAEKYHTQSAKLADREFSNLIKKTKYRKVILLSGGSASGKTEYMLTQLYGHKVIIFDTTLSTTIGAKIKINKCCKYDKHVEIRAVIPDNLSRAFVAFCTEIEYLVLTTFTELTANLDQL